MPRGHVRHARTAALAAIVGVCVAVPLAAASADSSTSGAASSQGTPAPTNASPVPAADFGTGVSDDSTLLPLDLSPTSEPTGGATAGPSRAPGAHTAETPSAAPTGRPDPATSAEPGQAPGGGAPATCGKAVDLPSGLRAQTCVEHSNGQVWGRVYYRNPTDTALSVVLVLVQPGGNTVRITCPVAAGEEQGRCDSPQQRAADADGWSALAEVASAKGGDKLLRAGTGGLGMG